MSLFDASLAPQFRGGGQQGRDYDLKRYSMRRSWRRGRPGVTVVDNHDTQPLQSLEAGRWILVSSDGLCDHSTAREG